MSLKSLSKYKSKAQPFLERSTILYVSIITDLLASTCRMRHEDLSQCSNRMSECSYSISIYTL